MNQQQPQPNQIPEPDKMVASIVRALALTENGGKLPLDNPSQGQSGEMKSIFQFTPGTWKMYSKQVLGQEVPMDKGSETVVVYGKVHNWLEEGLKPEEIASIWNSGKPDAYLHDHRGVNKYGVHYDTPGYVSKFTKYLQDSQNKKGAGSQQPQVQSSQPAPQAMPQVAPQRQGLLPGLMNSNLGAPPAKQVRQI